MRIAFVGQPNAGKSTIFNGLAGYKTITANFPGQTVHYTVSKVRVREETYEIVDLPGIYSLSPIDKAEIESRRYILSGEADVVVNVIDASTLSRSLELTLQLTELQVPLVICLNMIDEARRKGLEINGDRLSEIFGVPVVETIANKGIGLDKILNSAEEAFRLRQIPKIQSFHRDIEEKIEELEKAIPEEFEPKLPRRYKAVKLLEGDSELLEQAKAYSELIEKVNSLREQIRASHGRDSETVISSERHALSMNIFEEVTKIGEPEKSLRERVDDFIMNKYLGYPLLLAILFGVFFLVFELGSLIEEPLVGLFDSAIESLPKFVEQDSLVFYVLKGLLEGFAGGVGVAIPYLVPFFIALTFLEDIGYIPRMAFLLDSFMHRIGLHGKSVLPLVVSYGCSVPGVMATRILESSRDRLITAAISVLIPCAARTTVVFGLVGAYIGGVGSGALYLLNLAVITFLGKFLTKLIPEITPGLIMEIPPLRVPTLRSVIMKTWLRLKDFIVIAWPLLIISSIVLSFLEYFRLNSVLNQAFSPIVTSILGLPEQTGIPLLFGILRKELSMIMLFHAFDTTDLAKAMTEVQIIVFTIFTLFYMPCVGTVGVLLREFGVKRTLMIGVMTLILALTLSFTARLVLTLVL